MTSTKPSISSATCSGWRSGKTSSAATVTQATAMSRAPPGSVTALSPYTYYGREPARATIGEYSRVVLRADDVRRAHRELTAKGIVFETEPFDLHGGAFAALRDPWNNLFVLSDNADF